MYCTLNSKDDCYVLIEVSNQLSLDIGYLLQKCKTEV